MSLKLIESDANVIAGVLLTLKSSRIRSIKTIDHSVDVWEVYADGQFIQRLPSTVLSKLDAREYPSLACLSIMDVSLTSTSIKFGKDVVFEFEEWDYDEAVKLVEREHPGVYTALLEIIVYVATLAYYIEHQNEVKLGQYANAVLSWLIGHSDVQYSDLVDIHQRTLASLYLNAARLDDVCSEVALELLEKFHAYVLRDGIFYTPSGCVSKQLADIFIKTMFITQ